MKRYFLLAFVISCGPGTDEVKPTVQLAQSPQGVCGYATNGAVVCFTNEQLAQISLQAALRSMQTPTVKVVK